MKKTASSLIEVMRSPALSWLVHRQIHTPRTIPAEQMRSRHEMLASESGYSLHAFGLHVSKRLGHVERAAIAQVHLHILPTQLRLQPTRSRGRSQRYSFDSEGLYTSNHEERFSESSMSRPSSTPRAPPQDISKLCSETHTSSGPAQDAASGPKFIVFDQVLVEDEVLGPWPAACKMGTAVLLPLHTAP
jgi:hypothetical protein